MDLVEVGAFGLQWTRQRWETSVWARFEAMEVGNERLRLSRHGGGDGERLSSSGDGCSGSNGHGHQQTNLLLDIAGQCWLAQ